VSGPSEKISVANVKAAIAKMTNKMLVFLGSFKNVGVIRGRSEWMADMCNAVVKDGKIQEYWNEEMAGQYVQGQGRCLGVWLVPRHTNIGTCT